MVRHLTLDQTIRGSSPLSPANLLDEIRARDKAVPLTEICWCHYNLDQDGSYFNKMNPDGTVNLKEKEEKSVNEMQGRPDGLCVNCNHPLHPKIDCEYEYPYRLTQVQQDRRYLLGLIDNAPS